MPRRVGLPGASELFRNTQSASEVPGLTPVPPPADPRPRAGDSDAPREDEPRDGAAHSGRVRHDAKMTVYLSEDELFALDQSRLVLRTHGLKVDRGRIVRAAVAQALADLDARGERSDLVARLRDE
ncbi:hypothetical protein ACQB6R_08285 [Propionibacteriaceae bacterium G1746]